VTEPRHLVNEVLRLAPDLGELADYLEGEHPALFPGTLASRAVVGDRAGLPVDDDELGRRQREVAGSGARAVRKLRDEGSGAELDRTEREGLEAIVSLTLRPAILLRDGEFADPPVPWQALGGERAKIRNAASAVGRVELTGDPQGRPYGGTGFLVGPDLVMTNAHVARLFCDQDGAGSWSFLPGRAALALSDDPTASPSPRFEVTELVGVHPDYPGGPDLALFRIRSTTAGEPAPAPLVLSSEEPGREPGRKVYVLGYPAFDPRNDPYVQHLVFGDVYNVKRLQPGATMSSHSESKVFRHDCSTLGGNSGSCVIDLETNLVIGLHFSGLYLKYNEAVALWTLRDDPLLVAADVRFD
jgi:trypsin-like peptidase